MCTRGLVLTKVFNILTDWVSIKTVFSVESPANHWMISCKVFYRSTSALGILLITILSSQITVLSSWLDLTLPGE